MAYGRADTGNFVGGNSRPDPCSVDHDACIRLASGHALRDACSRVGIVDGICRERAEIVHGNPFGSERGHKRRFQRQTGVIAADRHAPYVADRSESLVPTIEQIVPDDRDAPCFQRVGCQRRNVTAVLKYDGFADVQRSRVSFRDDLEPFHVIFRATVTTLFTAEQISARIAEMAARINADYPDQEPLHFVAVLKGAFVFLSDLARAIAPRPVTLDFIAVSSYGAATKSSGEVRLLKDLDAPLQGRDVIIVEDIVDTGLTLGYLQDVLRARDPRTLRTACLLSKPSRRKVNVAVEYIGFEIEDKFVVGYGLDHAGQFRHLPFIGIQD